ncbi:Retrovirus-related Pol polyprotein from transposon [Ceratobasidium sp. AG-Ba]|nr:Retrovirus-related Pol polyprotein from transposon [Ceratobasidium sp. AG-Ba]
MEGGREVAMKVEARMTCYDGRDGGIGLVATIDGGAMLCVLDLAVWAEAEQSLGPLAPSQIVCRMANGACVRSQGTGRAWIEIRGVQQEVEFEVLDSRGAFNLLVGKTWLRAASALHNFANDTLILHADTGPIIVENQNPTLRVQEQQAPPAPAQLQPPPDQDEAEATEQEEDDTTTPINEEVMPEVRPIINDIEPDQQPFRGSKRLAEKRGAELYWVSAKALEDVERRIEASVDEEEEWWDALEVQTLDEAIVADPSVVIEASWKEEKEAEEERRLRQILWDDNPSPQIEVYALDDVLDRAVRNEARANMVPDPLPTKPRLTPSLRTTDPFNRTRVADIMSKVKIGDDLTAEQREKAEGLISEFADVFARSLSEVLPVDITELQLDIPDDATFPKKAGQRRLTEPQRVALYHTIDELEEAGIIERVSQDQVKAVSPLNMVPKQSSAPRPSIQQLQRMANAECIKYSIPVRYPEVGTEPVDEGRETQQAKWRLVQNFAAVNKVTQIRPFPMGDLPAKQRWAAGKRYVSVMDLQAGFHAIPIAKESVPYTGFHVDGRGYYVYRRMPFGLTGAPTTFCNFSKNIRHYKHLRRHL